MSSIRIKGIIRNGRVEVDEPINRPDGSEVTITGDGNVVDVSPKASFGAVGWTETKNERRCALIRKKFAQGIDAAENPRVDRPSRGTCRLP